MTVAIPMTLPMTVPMPMPMPMPVRAESLLVLAPDQHVDEDRHDGSRQQIGGQHREHDGQRLRREQEFRRVL